jgi:hypothetical protein
MKAIVLLASILAPMALGAVVLEPVFVPIGSIGVGQQNWHRVSVLERSGGTFKPCVSCGSNPYSNGTYEPVQIPELPLCSEGQHAEQWCLDLARENWRDNLDNIFGNCAQSWETKCAQYQACRAGCGNDLMCKQSCDSQWSNDQIAVFSDFMHSLDTANQAYQNQVWACCEDDE